MAVGTSLAVIAANSFAGLAGHWRHTRLDWGLTGAFLGLSLLGMAAGLPLAARMPVRQLSRVFASFVLGVAGFVLAKNWQALGP